MTSDLAYHVISAVLVLGVLLGIAMMSRVSTAVKGNALSAVCVTAAIALTLVHYRILSLAELWIFMAVGLVGGLYWASRIHMIQMPQVVALLNGFGGAASALVAVMTLWHGGGLPVFVALTAGLALLIGVITLTGSLVAAGKLHKLLSQRPVIFKNHQTFITLLLIASAVSLVLITMQPSFLRWMILLGIVASGLFGYVFAIRVGGADMPVTISLLNSLSGVAGSIAGMAINDQLLVAIGGIVGASGLLLTQIMCRGMNRRLIDVLLGKTSVAAGASIKQKTAPTVASTPSSARPIADILGTAKRVIIVPGYGMAIAQAQQSVAQLADKLENNGAVVDFAIHPVAGRMPGHMNVLLAEANVPYEKLREMESINGEFAECDLAIIIGANDVVNPAANTAEGTPIYGMPVLDADKAKHIIVCNFDRAPGYAGVDNPLYDRDNVTLMLGNAAETVRELLKEADGSRDRSSAASATVPDLGTLMGDAKRVIIIPGYGMALAQAQQTVAQLADKLENNGVVVDFAIHPVAGRMPGHMNVLLAEANVPYEKLREMESINDEFSECDLAIIIGANDVVNPAANTAEGTPIYGMPVLDAEKAKHVIVCNFDRAPGYAGVDNPLYDRDNVTLLLGNAAETVRELLEQADSAKRQSSGASSEGPDLTMLLGDAKRIIIIPGYGMAMAQAQQSVAQLADKLENNGAVVDFAIHPVAGRMPGHMNVLLAEANVPYEKLREMESINGEFSECDLVIIVGANDVVNPAANIAEGTPIYGMPILDADKAKHVIVCNFDRAPGYAGVDNPLYTRQNVTLMLGNAAETVREIMDCVR